MEMFFFISYNIKISFLLFCPKNMLPHKQEQLIQPLSEYGA